MSDRSDFVRMSNRLFVGFIEGVADYAEGNGGEDADKRTKAVGKQCLQRGMQPWRSNDRFGFNNRLEGNVFVVSSDTELTCRFRRFPFSFLLIRRMAKHIRNCT